MAAGQENYNQEGDLNLEATELRLGLPDQTSSSTATTSESKPRGSKRISSEMLTAATSGEHNTIPNKTQIVGWPPVRLYRKNNTNTSTSVIRSKETYVKVNMDGVPYLRKIDLKAYSSYREMMTVIESMFKVVMRDDYYISTYQDKDGDWMLAGDVPWDMFVESCKRVRIMKSSDAKGMGICRT